MRLAGILLVGFGVLAVLGSVAGQVTSLAAGVFLVLAGWRLARTDAWGKPRLPMPFEQVRAVAQASDSKEVEEAGVPLSMFCVLHAREHLHRMLEIDHTVRSLGWDVLDTYGIVADRIGYYVGCGWRGMKASSEAAAEELARHGVTPDEVHVYPRDEEAGVWAKRVAEGYYAGSDPHC
jgi:hypothetical protein